MHENLKDHKVEMKKPVRKLEGNDSEVLIEEQPSRGKTKMSFGTKKPQLSLGMLVFDSFGVCM